MIMGAVAGQTHIILMIFIAKDGGGRGIRTLDTVARIHAFQACAFSHSATPPMIQAYSIFLYV